MDVWPRDPDADMCPRMASGTEHERLQGPSGSDDRSMDRAIVFCRSLVYAYGLLVGAVSRDRYEARVRELIVHTDPVFVKTTETMLEVHQAGP